MARLLPSLDPPIQPSPPGPEIVSDYDDAARLLVRRWRLPLDDRCLPRTLSLYQCLRGEGLAVRMVFGVRPGERIEEGHAWLELDGEPLLEPEKRVRGFIAIFHHPEEPAPSAPRANRT